MKGLNLKTMSLAELKQLQKDLAKVIASFEERKKAEARATLEAKARELGFNLSELASHFRARAPGRPKYRHPENPDVTWTGRGRKPGWVQQHIAAGKPIEALEI